MKKLIYLVALFVFAACSSDHLYDSGEPALQEIQLYTGIGSITTKTSGDGMITNTLTAPLDVSFVLIEQPSGGSYPTDYATIDSLSAQIGSTNNKVTFETTQYYRSDGGKSKLISWYPRATWHKTTGKVSFPAIDGSTDILASTTVEGSKGDPITDSRKVAYEHVLTQITVSVSAATDADISMWGKINSIKLVGKAQTCELTLPATTATIGSKVTAAFAGSGDLSLVKLDNSGAVSEVTLTTTETAIGYAMLAPHQPNDALELKIETENEGLKNVSIAYAEMKLEAGTSYNVKLQFNATGSITPTATIKEWNTAPAAEQPGTVVVD